MIDDTGKMVQWGLTHCCDNDDENEILLSDITKKVSYDPCGPFLRLEYNLPTQNVRMIKVICGLNFCASISVMGHVYTWGDNEFG